MRRVLLALTLTAAASANEYGFLGYYFVDPDHPIHVAGRYRQIGSAEFEKRSRGDLHYADGYGAAFFTHFFNIDNSLSLGLGYDYMHLGWDKNPRFGQENFQYATASLGYVSTALEKWRWIINAGATVEANHLDFGRTGVYHTMLWGRYAFNQCCGWHVGLLGWYGVMNGYAMPIFGFDWKMNQYWTANVIYPLDFSLNFAFNDHWSLEAAFSGFGGPYRYPRRANEGRGGFHDPIFEVYSKGADLNLLYKYDHFLRVALGGGWNFGGWIFIKDHHNHKGKYFKYNSAPYAQGTVAFTF